jgi:hypothetical protein
MLNDFVAQVHDVFYEPLKVFTVGFNFMVFWVNEAIVELLPIFHLQVSEGWRK